ncbi:MAG: hypothetical protein EB119_04725 [Synechococcaceae bacterium WBB_34_004]|nr:hypothetical protein [Synechococcaceae bacterium WBB_34_004]
MHDSSSWLSQVLPLLQSPLGAVLFVPLYAVWVTLLLPGVWASMLAGALYGPWWGSLVVFIGTILFCGLGALAGDVARFGEVLSGRADPLSWAVRIIGLFATLASVWFVGKAAQRVLNTNNS